MSQPTSTSPFELAIISDEISLDLEESLRHGEAFGIRTFEIRCLDDYDHRVPDLRPGRAGQLQSLVESGRIIISALSPGIFKIRPGETDRLRHELDSILPRTCKMANRLGAPRVIVFAFLRNGAGGRDAALGYLREAAGVAAAHGLQLSIENEPGAYADTGVNTAQLVGEIDLPNVGVNWDPANAVYSGEAAWPVGYEAVLPHIQNIHLKDGIPLPDGQWENRLIGDGGVNWPGQLRALIKDRPVPHLTLETHVFPLLESTREDLRRLQILFAAARDLEPPTSGN